ncbi:MAG: hypothetical protein WBE92_13230 [Steroidobacteraceae bacterium]
MYPRVGKSPDGERDPAHEAIAQKLRQLPVELAPPFDWSELQRRSRMRAARGPRAAGVSGRAEGLASKVGYRSLALAAGVALIAVAAALAIRFNHDGRAVVPARAQTALLARPVARTVASPEPEALLARADTAERWLASEPEDGPVVRVSTHLAVAHLEDRLASVDDLLNVEQLQHARAARLRTLQLQRAQLVDSLAQVRYAEILDDETP